MKTFILSTLLLFVSYWLSAQYLTGIGTKWSDAFTEWILYTDDEDVEGELTMRWQMQGDWTEWDYRIGEESGSIQRKWKNDPSQWEISGGNELIIARMVWNNDLSEWRITNNSQTLTIKSRWNNNFNEWNLKSDRYGTFTIFTEWENDPREWIVEDYLDDTISIHMKIAILFVVTHHSYPKN
jgi:hypothetical protein